MTADQIEACDKLWREALEAGLVRWMPGMLALAPGWQPLRLAHEFFRSVWSGVAGDEIGHDYAHNVGDDALPVWADPATIGCLLALAREATGCHAHSASYYAQLGAWAYDWNRTDGTPVDGALSMTEPEALLRAILATRGER